MILFAQVCRVSIHVRTHHLFSFDGRWGVECIQDTQSEFSYLYIQIMYTELWRQPWVQNLMEKKLLKPTTDRRKPSKNIDLSLFNRFDSVLTFKFFNYSTMMNDDYKTSQQISNWNFHVKVTTIDYNLILMPYVQISNFKIFGIFTRISSAYNCCKLPLNRLRKSV